MSKHREFIAALLAAASFSLPAMAQDADTVVATVNGTDITVGHMIVVRRALPSQYQELPDEILFEGVLQRLIRETVLSQSLEGDAPESARFSIENETRSILADAAARRAIGDVVTEEAIRAAYEESHANAEPEIEYNASHILVETVEEAKALISQLQGGADFVELAREHSTGPSGPNGGNLGWFGPGAMVPPFEEAVVELQPGEISDPVETQFGWHVVTLNATRERPVPALEEVQEQIVAEIGQRAVEERVRSLMDAAGISRVAEGEMDPSILSNPDVLSD